MSSLILIILFLLDYSQQSDTNNGELLLHHIGSTRVYDLAECGSSLP